jgi:hypothetical protein
MKSDNCSEVFNCQVVTLPLKLLEVPTTFSSLKMLIGILLDGKVIKRLDAWIENSCSSSGRLIFLDSSLTGIPSYYFSMLLLNKSFH